MSVSLTTSLSEWFNGSEWIDTYLVVSMYIKSKESPEMWFEELLSFTESETEKGGGQSDHDPSIF